jgi:hypothetical protein
MKFSSMRRAIVITSVIVGSLIPSQTFAQTTALFTGGAVIGQGNGAGTSTYKFTGSMILNSIGFFTLNNETRSDWSYSLKGQTYQLGTHFSVSDLSDAENGVRWLNITPQSMVNNETVTVSSRFIASTGTTNNSVNVAYQGFVYPDDGNLLHTDWTNSNIRVSNPGSNVAPEPGSFALALTGGAALLGICVRRRRNAG